MRRCLILILSGSFTISVFGQENYSDSRNNSQSNNAPPEFNIMGKWKVFKVTCYSYRGSHWSKNDMDKEVNSRINRIVLFTQNLVYDSTYPPQWLPSQELIICNAPNYRYEKQSIMKYLQDSTELVSSKDDSLQCKWLGYNYTDTIEIINTKCGVPFNQILFLNKNIIIGAVDEFLLYLKKE